MNSSTFPLLCATTFFGALGAQAQGASSFQEAPQRGGLIQLQAANQSKWQTRQAALPFPPVPSNARVLQRDERDLPLLWSVDTIQGTANKLYLRGKAILGPSPSVKLDTACATADGRQVIAQYASPTGRGGQLLLNGRRLAITPERRLNVQLDPSHRHWMVAMKTNGQIQFLLDGCTSPVYTDLDGTLGADGHWYGWAKRGKQMFLLRDTQETPVEAVTPVGKTMRYRPTRDGGIESEVTHGIFAVKRGGGAKWTVLVDGQARAQLTGVSAASPPCVSEDGTQWALITSGNRQIVVNGKVITPLYNGFAVPPAFSSRSYFYAVRRGSAILPVINGTVQPQVKELVSLPSQPPIVSEQRRWAYIERRIQGETSRVRYFIGGVPQRDYTKVGPIQWDTFSQGWCYTALRDGKNFAVINGQEFGPYTSVSGIALAGSHWLLTGMKEDQPLVVLDSVEQEVAPEAAQTESPFVNGEGHSAYVGVTEESKKFAVLDGKADNRKFSSFRFKPSYLTASGEWLYITGPALEHPNSDEAFTLVAGEQYYPTRKWDILLSPDARLGLEPRHWMCVLRSPDHRVQAVADGTKLLAPANTIGKLWFPSSAQRMINSTPTFFWAETRGVNTFECEASPSYSKALHPQLSPTEKGVVIVSSGPKWIAGKAPNSKEALETGDR